jgi:hypothetical protein
MMYAFSLPSHPAFFSEVLRLEFHGISRVDRHGFAKSLGSRALHDACRFPLKRFHTNYQLHLFPFIQLVRIVYASFRT